MSNHRFKPAVVLSLLALTGCGDSDSVTPAPTNESTSSSASGTGGSGSGGESSGAGSGGVAGSEGVGGAGAMGGGGVGADGGDGGTGGAGGPAPDPVACGTCIFQSCPDLIACGADPVCGPGLACAALQCLAGGAPDLICVADCFGGDILAAANALQAIACVVTTCGADCGGFLPQA